MTGWGPQAVAVSVPARRVLETTTVSEVVSDSLGEVDEARGPVLSTRIAFCA